jgi:hypothetical protein
MVKKVRLLLFFLARTLATSAQVNDDFPPARLISKFNFIQLSGGVVVLRATLDAFPDTLNFILDTGSGGISLDTLTATYYKLPLEPSERTVKGIGGTRQLSFYKKGVLHFPGVTVENLDFHINDYEILTEVYGLRIDGIIGFSLLRRFILTLDYEKQEVSFYSPGAYNYPRKGTLLHPTFANLPITEHEIKDMRSYTPSFYFDTGAGLCVMFADQFIKDSVFLNPKRKTVHTQVEGLVGKINMKLSTMRRIKIGNFHFKKVPIHIYQDSVNLFNYPTLVGLIGSDLLRRFNIVLNYPERSIHLTPNSHIQESFDYSYTGMNFYFIDGRIVITEIQQGSPADKAGFQPGDIIFGIENNFSNNIQQYRLLLQQHKQKVRIIIYRNSVPQMIELKIGSILK